MALNRHTYLHNWCQILANLPSVANILNHLTNWTIVINVLKIVKTVLDYEFKKLCERSLVITTIVLIIIL